MKRGKYQTKLSLYPMTLEKVVDTVLTYRPKKKKQKRSKIAKKLEHATILVLILGSGLLVKADSPIPRQTIENSGQTEYGIKDKTNPDKTPPPQPLAAINNSDESKISKEDSPSDTRKKINTKALLEPSLLGIL